MLFPYYRPISLLPTFSKILEQVMVTRMKFLEKNKTILEHQYGFQKGQSISASWLLDLLNNINNWIF